MYEIVKITAHWYPAGAYFGEASELIDLYDSNPKPFMVDGKLCSNLDSGGADKSFNPDDVFEPVSPEKRHLKYCCLESLEGQYDDTEVLQTKQDFVHFVFEPIVDKLEATHDGLPYMKAMLEWRNEYELYEYNILEVWEYLKKQIERHYSNTKDGYGYEWSVLTLWTAYAHCSQDYYGDTDCEDIWEYRGILNMGKLNLAVASPNDPDICDITTCSAMGTQQIDGKWYCIRHVPSGKQE